MAPLDPESDTANPVYSATTTAAGTAVVATQVSGDYGLDSLDLGQYSVVESGPDDTDVRYLGTAVDHLQRHVERPDRPPTSW